jgi:hypothetical protein
MYIIHSVWKAKRYIIKITTPRSIACHFANPVIIKAKVAIIASNEFGPFQGVSFFIFYSWNGHGKAKLQQVNERGLRRNGRYNYFARRCCYGSTLMAISQNLRNVSKASSGACFLHLQNAPIRLWKNRINLQNFYIPGLLLISHTCTPQKLSWSCMMLQLNCGKYYFRGYVCKVFLLN